MKRILALLLALEMLFCLTACSGGVSGTSTGEKSGAPTNTTESTNSSTDGTQDITQGTTDASEDNHKHSYTSKITIQPTCKEDGQKTYSCSCGEAYSEPVASIDHQYGHKVTNPTCINEGYTTYTCTVCGNSYRDNFTHPTGHNWMDNSCKTPTICVNCSAVAETETGYEAGHDWIAATCTTPATCRVCGITGGSADGHNYSRWDIWDYPTCTEEGYEVSWCTRCDNRELRPVQPRGHKYVAGICSVCGDDNNVYANVNGVTLNHTTLNLKIGDTKQLTVTVMPENAKDKSVTWSSSNSSVAQVSSTGKVTAKGKGSATITVTTTDGNYSATCTVVVSEPSLTVSVSMGVGFYTGSSGSVRGVFAEANASGGSGNYVEYYIKVYYNGQLVAEGAEDEMIVTLANGTYTAEVYVKDSSGNEATASKSFTCQGY